MKKPNDVICIDGKTYKIAPYCRQLVTDFIDKTIDQAEYERRKSYLQPQQHLPFKPEPDINATEKLFN